MLLISFDSPFGFRMDWKHQANGIWFGPPSLKGHILRPDPRVYNVSLGAMEVTRVTHFGWDVNETVVKYFGRGP